MSHLILTTYDGYFGKTLWRDSVSRHATGDSQSGTCLKNYIVFTGGSAGGNKIYAIIKFHDGFFPRVRRRHRYLSQFISVFLRDRMQIFYTISVVRTSDPNPYSTRIQSSFDTECSRATSYDSVRVMILSSAICLRMRNILSSNTD